jgi:drug/metabolite transporter (DMT)-like permease
MRVGTRLYGATLVAAAGVFWSTGGIFVRLLDMDLWTMLVWRSLFAALFLLLVVVVRYGRKTAAAFGRLGAAGLAAVPISAISMVSFVAALKLTTVANVLMVYATVPFVAAGIAYVWLKERPSREALLASAAALVGIVIIVGGALRPHDIAGNALAFLMTVTFGIVLVMARRHQSLDMATVNALAAGLCGLACLPLAQPGLPSPYELVVLALFGLMTTALAYLLFLTGGRYIPSGEAGLIGLLDVVLGPIWVWLLFREDPGEPALIGGGIVLASVVWYLWRELRVPARSAQSD